MTDPKRPAVRPARRVRPLRAVLATTVLAMSMAWIVAPAPAQAAFVGKNDSIVFSALMGDGSVRVFRQGPNGSLVDLTGASATPSIKDHDNFSPAWSPEQGAHVAFVSAAPNPGGDHGPGDVYWAIPFPDKEHGAGLVNLTHSNDADDESPAWDFTGGKLTWARAEVNGGVTQPFDIWRTTWTGRDRTNLTPGTASDDIEPAWAPRSGEIAFASNRTDASGHSAGGTYGIWLMNALTGAIERQITANGRAPNWNPSGNLITFVRGGEVWTVHSNGRGFEQITHEAPHVADKPVFSPDGGKILYETGQLDGAIPTPDIPMQLATVNVDGTGRKIVVADPRFKGQSEPDWKPGCSVQPKKVHGSWVVTGTAGADLICFEKFPTTIFAGAGNDSIYGGPADNVIHAGGGDDIVLGAKGNDVLNGHAGNDYLEADDGNDKVFGGTGDDSMFGGGGNDTLTDAGPTSGHDSANGGEGSDVCVVDTGDQKTSCETIRFTQPMP